MEEKPSAPETVIPAEPAGPVVPIPEQSAASRDERARMQAVVDEAMRAAHADLSPTVRALIEALREPEFDGLLEVGTCGGATFRLQFAFLALEAVVARFGSYEAMGERIVAAANDGNAQALLGANLAAAETILRGATKRHHPALDEDELDDVFALMGDATSVIFLSNAAMSWWQERDRLGPYVAGLDPVVQLGEKAYTLRFALKAVRHVQTMLGDDDFQSLQPKHYREVLRAMLLRHHGQEFAPGNEQADAILDDLGWHIGLGGLRRLMAGAEQPKRPADDVAEGADPNAPAGAAAPAGTGQAF